MAKLTKTQAQDIWAELKLLSPAVKVKKMSNSKKPIVSKAPSQMDKNRALGQALDLRDDSAFEKALKAGANPTYDRFGDTFHLLVFQEGTLKMAELLFEYGLAKKNINHNDIWESVIERQAVEEQELNYWKLLFKNGIYPNRDFYKWNIADLVPESLLAQWWALDAVFDYPEQYSKISNGGFEKVFETIISPILEKGTGDFFEDFWVKLKKNQPTMVKKIQSPSHAGKLWMEALGAYREKDKDIVSCLQSFIRCDILPPARKSISKSTGNKKNQMYSWPTICIDCSDKYAFNFLMKSPKMVELFQEDVQDNPQFFIQEQRSVSFAADALLEAGLNLKLKNTKGQHFFYEYFDEQKISISPKLHQFLQENAEFILESKDRTKRTCFMEGKNSSYAIDERKVVLGGQKMGLDEYRILLERFVLDKKIKNSGGVTPAPKVSRQRL